MNVNSDVVNYLRNKYLRINLVVLAYVGATLICSCSTDKQAIRELIDQKNAPSVIVYNSELIYTEMGNQKMRVYAPVTNYYQFAEEPYTKFDEGIEVNTFDDSLKIESKLTANFAQFFEKNELWLARNNVVAQNRKGDVLYTEELYWDQKTHTIYSDVIVRIKTSNGNVYGKGLISDDSFENWEVKEPYDGEIEIEN